MAELLLFLFGVALGWMLRPELKQEPSPREWLGTQIVEAARGLKTQRKFCGSDVDISWTGKLSTLDGEFKVTVEEDA